MYEGMEKKENVGEEDLSGSDDSIDFDTSKLPS